MLAAHGQGNRVFGHSIGNASVKKHGLQPKTPGAKFPKTPLKVPLNDENGAARLAGKNQTVGKAGKAGPVTPLEPRTSRAPLGNKTTNAKANTVRPQLQQKQALAVKERVREIESSQQQQQTQPRTARRPRVISPRVNAFKLSVLNDDNANGKHGEGEDDIEYAPARVPARPYESDVYPDGVLKFSAFRPENRLRGYYDHYYNPVDADGVPQRDKEFAEKQRRAFEKLDVRVQEDLDSLDWSIGDVPASKGFLTKQKPSNALTAAAPPTIVARKAASALALSSKSNTATALQTKTAKPINARATTTAAASSKPFLSALPLRKDARALPVRPKGNNYQTAESASRTTLGYNKGRSASSLVRTKSTTVRPQTQRPPVSTLDPEAVSSLTTPAYSTPKRAARDEELFGREDSREEETKTPAFVSIFEVDEERDLGGAATFINDDLDDEFQLDIQF